MSRSDILDKKIGDRVDALQGKRPSPINTRNAAILAGALALGGGYFGVKASDAVVPENKPLDVTAAQAPAAPPRRDTLFAAPAMPLPPIKTGPSDLEIKMANLMGAVENLGARIDAVATAPSAPTVDPAAQALLEELRNLAQSNEAMRKDLESRIESAETSRRNEARDREALEMQIAELRAEMLSGQRFGSRVPFAEDEDGEDPAAVAALAEAEHRRDMERLRLEAELARADRLESERLEREREARAHEREKELRSLDAHYTGREADREAAQEDRQRRDAVEREAREAAIARMDTLEAKRIAQANTRLAEERARRDSGGVAFEEAGTIASAAGPAGSALSSRQRTEQGIRQTRNEAWLDTAAQEGIETAYAVNLPHPDRLIAQGTLITGIMETAIQSDLPGGIRAVVSDPVWSADGSSILLPAGSRLIGQYRSDIAIGQTRVLVAWTRAITPDHRSVSLGSSGADALGRGGQGGKVDTHFAQKFEAAFLVSIVTGLANFSTGAVTAAPYLNEGIDNGIAASADAANGTLEEYLSISPTIHIDQGSPVTVFVQRDLYL